jgi:hypothetical protein
MILLATAIAVGLDKMLLAASIAPEGIAVGSPVGILTPVGMLTSVGILTPVGILISVGILTPVGILMPSGRPVAILWMY